MKKTTLILLTTALASLLVTGCNDSTSEPRSERSGLLPVSTISADGDDMLAGTYDPQTGGLLLTTAVVDALVVSVGDTGRRIVLSTEESADELDVAARSGYTSVDLAAGASVDVVGESEHARDIASIGVLTIHASGWVDDYPEGRARTSFPDCDFPWEEEDDEDW